MKRKNRHFLRIGDLTKGELSSVLNMSAKLKRELKRKGKNKEHLRNKTLIAIYEKPSLRTRISFDIGMTQLGGHSIYLAPSDIKMGERESPKDVGIVSSSMADVVMARTFEHETVEKLAEGSSVPVINGLSDLEHPCQVLADFLTIKEIIGGVKGLKIAFVGDGNNNVTHSLCMMSSIFGNEFRCAAPKGYEMNKKVVKEVDEISKSTGAAIVQTTNPGKAVEGADVVVTDTWVSMGSEKDKKKRLKAFLHYQVTKKLMKRANKKAIFMHCLPAYRGKEVSGEVIDGSKSVVYQEAENRLHAQKGLICFLLGVKV